MINSREQKLIDILFSVMMLVTDPQYSSRFIKMSMEQKAKWIRKQLGNEFITKPCGSSWGVLSDDKN